VDDLGGARPWTAGQFGRFDSRPARGHGETATISMIPVGEQTGGVYEMLTKIANFQSRLEIQCLISRAVSHRE